MPPKVWLLTGTSSGLGLGRCMTEHVLKRGDIAVATLRRRQQAYRREAASDILDGGYTSPPTLGVFHASKFALEGLSESLAAEVDPEWDIKVSVSFSPSCRTPMHFDAQITVIEVGGFGTDAVGRIVIMPHHPAYMKPSSIVAATRSYIDNFGEEQMRQLGNPIKAAAIMFRLAAYPDPPLHFPLGKDSVATTRRKIALLAEETDKFESWSKGI
ncbi:uncharacterized protein FIBRA_08895 [Fibroporia radiculosa]|uniref:Uncharacterized protein n=1 Tax=Fibroporia radiculosa TaxID=599839 RepID=J4ICL4_9APHY|nr:uncharacterized protein FIBRA_08895 [Fibroporia radiculosa]CCM06616.1 predicted protein [Fibroporia radiculosa]